MYWLSQNDRKGPLPSEPWERIFSILYVFTPDMQTCTPLYKDWQLACWGNSDYKEQEILVVLGKQSFICCHIFWNWDFFWHHNHSFNQHEMFYRHWEPAQAAAWWKPSYFLFSGWPLTLTQRKMTPLQNNVSLSSGARMMTMGWGIEDSLRLLDFNFNAQV